MNASLQYSSYQEDEASNYQQGDYYLGTYEGNKQTQRADNEEKEKNTILTLIINSIVILAAHIFLRNFFID